MRTRVEITFWFRFWNEIVTATRFIQFLSKLLLSDEYFPPVHHENRVRGEPIVWFQDQLQTESDVRIEVYEGSSNEGEHRSSTTRSMLVQALHRLGLVRPV
eukprot:IDg16875t1